MKSKGGISNPPTAIPAPNDTTNPNKRSIAKTNCLMYNQLQIEDILIL